MYEPAIVFAVKIPDLAIPLLSVVVADPFAANVPLAPETGADQETATPCTGFPAASLVLAPNGVGYAVPARVLCGVPAVAVIVVAGPATTVRIPELVAARVPSVARICALPRSLPANVADFLSPLATRSPSTIPPVLFCRLQLSAVRLEMKLPAASLPTA